MQQNFEEIVKRSVENTPGFAEVYQLAKNLTSGGKIYVVGGLVYRSLAKGIHGGTFNLKDIDILTADPFDLNNGTLGFSVTENSFRQPKFHKNGLTADIFAMKDLDDIVQNKRKPSIENFLLGCPLNVQSVAFDLEEVKIYGPACISAINDKTVMVHNRERLEIYCRRKNFSPHNYMQEMAISLDFRVQL